MPYTPPSHCSPASTTPNSPNLSRRSSFATQSRPALPHSTSYLTKHRRSISAANTASISVTNHGSASDMTPPGTSANSKEVTTSLPSSVRQSPPPMTDARAMPAGAIISPPESSSEDEGVTGREEQEREMDNIKELKEAISAIPQCRVGSPNGTSSSFLFFPTEIQQFAEAPSKPTILTAGLKPGRAPSHSRSNTDTNIYFSKSAEFATSEESSEQDEMVKKPPMLRKKSGELVRPALRPAAMRRPSSMPGTPTFSKAVHFDSHLEHVRHFLQVDRPLAVSTGSSPVENYDSDTEYPFKFEKAGARPPPHEWEVVMNNFAADTLARKQLPARLERVWMSPDQKSLIGSISVANLAFQKLVVCRFTFDYWKTTSEVAAQFHDEIRMKPTETGHDRFQFSIKLSDIANLEAKTLFFCIRYNVNGAEFWDNNNQINYQVDFRKKFIPRNGKKGPQGASSRPANTLPRSNRRASPSTAARPKSMPPGSMDQFGPTLKVAVADSAIHDLYDESEPTGLRLKGSKSTTSLPSDNLTGRLPAPSGAAFANRYDFSVSLSAAKQAQRSPNSSPTQNDGLYMKAHQRNVFASPAPAEVPRSQANVPKMSFAVQQPTGFKSFAAAPATSSPGRGSPASASIANASYEEILNKYCFFNSSKQTSPQPKDGTLPNGRYDGADEYPTRSSTGPSFLSEIPAYNGGTYRAGDSPPQSPRQGRPADSSDPTSPTDNYVASSGTTLNGSVNGPIPYQHTPYISPFSSDARSPTAISC